MRKIQITKKKDHKKRTNRFFKISMLLLVSGMVMFGMNFFGDSGKFNRDYYSNLYTWNKEKLPERLGKFEMAYKIMPGIDPLRNRDRFPMDYRGKSTEADTYAVQWQDFFNYRESFFWFNNTVKNFP